MSKFTFDRISGALTLDSEKVVEVNEYFYVYDQMFSHEEEGLDFNYSYGLEVSRVEQGVYFTLYLIVQPDSLSRKVKAEIDYGEDFEIELHDIVIDGSGAVPMGSDLYEIEESQIEAFAQNIFSLVPGIDTLRGFYLDKRINQFGTTGWDIILYALGQREKLF